MTRRNIKRVDYKNIKPINIASSSDESEIDDASDDDDFVSSLTPPTKKRKSTTAKKKDDSSEVNKNKNKNEKAGVLQVDSKKKQSQNSFAENAEHFSEEDLLTAVEISPYDDNEDDFDCASSKKRGDSKTRKTDPSQVQPRRNTRNSNTEHCLRKDLQSAIEISQGDRGKHSPKDDDNVGSIVSHGHDIKESVEKRSTTGNKGLHGKENVPVNTSYTAKDNDSKPRCASDRADSVSEKVVNKLTSRPKKVLSDRLKRDASIQQSPVSAATTMPLTPKVLVESKNEKIKALTPDIASTLTGRRKDTTPTPLTNSATNTNKVITPGKLRLGLSRNIRVAKPLHSNVVIS